MNLPRFHFLERFLDAYYIRQLKAFMEWRERHGLQHDGLFISLPRQVRTVGKGNLAFIVCSPRGLLHALKKINRHDPSAWHILFQSTELEIWEYQKRYQWQTLPLRFGLTEKEKNQALAYARDALETYLKTGELPIATPEDMSPRFLELANVEVALWAGGMIRGSRIVLSSPLITAIRKAAANACRDERFKPLSMAELEATRIEIAVLSDLQIPLLRREISANLIATEKGYVLSARGREGWYVPAVFNCVFFRDFNDFLTHLIEEKAGVSRIFLQTADIRTFEVDNFIESGAPPRTALSLRGPIVRRPFESDQAFKTVRKMAEQGADFVCRAQENDGNIFPIIDPLTGKKTQIDWSRLAFAAWSLALSGTAFGAPKYTTAARKALAYLIKNLPSHPYVNNEGRCYAYVYAYHAAFLLGEAEISAQLHQAIWELAALVAYSPILYSQIALQLLTHGSDKNYLLERAQQFTTIVHEDFEHRLRTGPYLALAEFPELIPLLRIIGNLRGDAAMIKKSEDISEWYATQQLLDGAFPSTVGSRFSYVRGSGKIFEVMCSEPKKNWKCIERAICWLSEMQYVEDNTYFIKPDIRAGIIGAFRHDYVNQAAWIDATAHVLIGASRLVDNVLQK